MIAHVYKSGIVIQRFTSVTDGMGGFTDTWATHLTISGYIRTLSGEERLSGDKQTVYATNRLYCENADITEKDQVVDDSNTYQIKFINQKLDLKSTVRFLEIDLLKIN